MSEEANESNKEKNYENDKVSMPNESNDNMKNCKVCGEEVMKNKIIMHLTRSKKGCKKKYGKEFEHLKAEQAMARKEYKKLKRKEQSKRKKEFKAKIHEKVMDSDTNFDDLDEDEEVQKFFDLRNDRKLQNKEAYEKIQKKSKLTRK